MSGRKQWCHFPGIVRSMSVAISVLMLAILRVLPLAAVGPQINPGGLVNGASYAQPGVLTPGGIFALFGTGLSDGSIATAAGNSLPIQLAGARVLVNGVPAPLFYVSFGQINAQFPVEAA